MKKRNVTAYVLAVAVTAWLAMAFDLMRLLIVQDKDDGVKVDLCLIVNCDEDEPL